jgi:hypothetical protein
MVSGYSDRTLHFTPHRICVCCAWWPQCSLHSMSRLKACGALFKFKKEIHVIYMFHVVLFFLTFVIKVPDNGFDRSKHVALCCMTFKCCVWRYIPLYFNCSKHNGMNTNKCGVLCWVVTDFYIDYFNCNFNLWSCESDNLVARNRRKIGFRNTNVRDIRWQSVGQIRQTDNCSTDNTMWMDPLAGCNNKEH